MPSLTDQAQNANQEDICKDCQGRGHFTNVDPPFTCLKCGGSGVFESWRF